MSEKASDVEADLDRRSGRRQYRWLWLLAILPLIPILTMLLFFGMATGSRLVSTLTGPVNLWNTSSKNPRSEDLAGWYKLADTHSNDRKLPELFVSERSGFLLRADHTLEVIDLPAFDNFGQARDCHFNGTGTWSLYGAPGQIELNMHLLAARSADRGSLPACGPENFSSFVLLGHSLPYRLWYSIGDPDEDEGLLYGRQPRD